MISLITHSENDTVRQVLSRQYRRPDEPEMVLIRTLKKILVEGREVYICIVDVQTPQVKREHRSERINSKVVTVNEAELGHFLILQPVV